MLRIARRMPSTSAYPKRSASEQSVTSCARWETWVMNKIDPAEAALAVIGVDAVISRAVERVTAAQRKDMRRLDKAIRFKVKSALADEPSAKYALPPDYMKLLTDLTSPMMPD